MEESKGWGPTRIGLRPFVFNLFINTIRGEKCSVKFAVDKKLVSMAKKANCEQY